MNCVWHPMTNADLPMVNELADGVHASLPERPEVFEEKLSLFPMGCRKLVVDGKLSGYGMSHPWMLGSIPPLNEFLLSLPNNPNCLYVHDIAVAPEARGSSAAGRYLDLMCALAEKIGIRSLALVSVYGTAPLWSRFGFMADKSPAAEKLATYGPSAAYMVLACNRPGFV